MNEKPKWPNFLRLHREKVGLSQIELAEKAGTSVQNISRWERGDRKLTTEWAEKIAPFVGTSPQWIMFHPPGDDIGEVIESLSLRRAKAMGVSVDGFERIDVDALPVRGEVAAGRWLETAAFLDWSEISEYIDGIGVPAGQRKYTYGLRVRGTSINKIAKDGEILVCLDLTSGIEIHERDLVIVERIRADGALREVTAKRLARVNGIMVLMPESTDPLWQQAIEISDTDHEDSEIRIVAKVKHVIRPIS